MSTKMLEPRERGADLKKMTDAQRVFCLEYVANGGKVAEAARIAYPKSKNPSSAGNKALRHPAVKAYLGKMLKEKLDQSELGADRLLKHLATALFLDPMDMFHCVRPGVYEVKALEDIPPAVRQCITKLKTRTRTKVFDDGSEETTNTIEIELMSKDDMMNLAMKFRGLLQPDETTKVNVGFQIDFDTLAKPPSRQDIVEGKIAGVAVEVATKKVEV